jgi:ribosome-associated translation inhibitor RaiA
MSTLLTPTIQDIEQNPEVKSFIYQMIAEFDPFVTPQTVVTVVARDPKKLAIQYETEGREFTPADLKKLYRIAISLNESGTKVEAEGVHEDIYQAIKMAKDNLLKELVAIQDSVVSQQDRLIEINHYLQHPVLH